MCKTKICSKCEETKDVELFTKGKNRCKKCTNQKHKEYVLKNKEKINARDRERYKENIEFARVRSREWGRRNKDSRKEYREKNKEVQAVYYKKYYEENKEVISKRIKNYKQENRESTLLSLKKYRQENLDNRYLKRVLKDAGVKKEEVSDELKNTIIIIAKTKRELKRVNK